MIMVITKVSGLVELQLRFSEIIVNVQCNHEHALY